MQRAQLDGGMRVEGGVGGVAELELVALARACWSTGSMMDVRLRVGSASVGFVGERKGGWMIAAGFLRGGCLGACGGMVVKGVVEGRLVMRRGRGMRLWSGAVEVEVGWMEGAERLWEMEGRRAIGEIERRTFCGKDRVGFRDGSREARDGIPLVMVGWSCF